MIQDQSRSSETDALPRPPRAMESGVRRGCNIHNLSNQTCIKFCFLAVKGGKVTLQKMLNELLIDNN